MAVRTWLTYSNGVGFLETFAQLLTELSMHLAFTVAELQACRPTYQWGGASVPCASRHGKLFIIRLSVLNVHAQRGQDPCPQWRGWRSSTTCRSGNTQVDLALQLGNTLSGVQQLTVHVGFIEHHDGVHNNRAVSHGRAALRAVAAKSAASHPCRGCGDDYCRPKCR